MMLIRSIVFLCLLCPTLARGQAIEFPNPPLGQVLDAGSWLGDARRIHLENELGRYRKAYQIDVMVVLWDRGLPPETGVEELAERLGETWTRENIWVVVLHIPDSLHRPAIVAGGVGTKRFMGGLTELALQSAALRGMKERTTRAQIEALGLEAGGEFVFLKNRSEFERKEYVAHHDQQLRDQEDRHQSMIFRAVISTLLALMAVGVVAALYLLKGRPTDLEFPQTRWRRRLGAKWSGGGQIVVSLPPRIS